MSMITRLVAFAAMVNVLQGNSAPTEKFRWKQRDEGLVVRTNDSKPCEAAYAFRIHLK